MAALKYYNAASYYQSHPYVIHGRAKKDMVVLHETVSGDLPGLSDIKAVEAYLVSIGYGIHGMTDLEGNIAWARGYGNAVVWQCGGVNERSIGIEQVARTPKDSPASIKYWNGRTKQLQATSWLLAAIHNTWSIPLVYSNGDSPGITSHWSVSQIYPASMGHWDCHPVHLGGYYPALSVINRAKLYAKTGITLT